MIVTSSPMLEKYSRTNLRIQVFRPRRNFFPKPSQIHLKASPEYVQASPNMSQTSRKSDPDMTKKWPKSRPILARSVETRHVLYGETRHVLSWETRHVLCGETRHVLSWETRHVLCGETRHVLSWETRMNDVSLVMGCKTCHRMQDLSEDARLVIGCKTCHRMQDLS